ncbi:MAG: tetratricopeptide repeat protein [Marinobacter sp.]|nr:tetratricopeptide repeat protein [Marinobacter sp.]
MKGAKNLAVLLALLALVGCSTAHGPIYAPMGGAPSQPAQSRPAPPPEPPSAPPPAPVQQDAVQDPQPQRQPVQRHAEQGEPLSPAARSLVERADALISQGDTQGAIAQLERAQRISPRSPEVYFKLAEAYALRNQLGSAEQFTLRGLSLAGNNERLQRSGWMLLADIRRAAGNMAGAAQADARAASL